MKTKKQVTAEHSEYKGLINAVIGDIGMESVADVIDNGIDGGYGGFIYYSDTVGFYKKHKKDILKLAEELALELGEDMLSMIQHFNCLMDRQSKKPDFSQNEIGKAIYSFEEFDGSRNILNAMAWFAAEEVCRWFEE